MIPTEKQISYAQDLQKITGLQIPNSALYDGKLLGAYIEETKNAYDQGVEHNKRVPIQDLAEYAGYHTRRVGTLLTLQEHDSVRIDTSDNIYYRYSTGQGGTIYDFAQDFCGAKNFREAYTLVATFNGYQHQKADPAREKPFEVQMSNYVADHRSMLMGKNTRKIPIVINAFGGPGAGKSTACMEICAKLKKLGYSAEYVQEYVKDLVYEKRFDLLDGTQQHQYGILKEQIRRMDRLYDQTDFIVTDAPILLNVIYNQELTPHYKSCIQNLHNQYENFAFFIERNSNFQQEGRIHNLQESIEKDKQIKQLLIDNGIYFGVYDHETADKIVKNAITTYERLNRVQLPEKEKNMYNVYAYLTKTRGLDRNIIQDMVNRKMLYQGTIKGTYTDKAGNKKPYSYDKNCVFVSYDKDGSPVFASYRGTNTYAKRRILGDCKGNNNNHGFYIYNGSDKLVVAESVIDALSIMNIMQVQGISYHDYDYCIISGVQKTNALMRHLEDEPKKEIYLALDNDEAGKKAVQAIAEEIMDHDYCCWIQDATPPEDMGKDWNECLVKANKWDVQDLDITNRENVKSLEFFSQKKVYGQQNKFMMQNRSILQSRPLPIGMPLDDGGGGR